MKWFIFTFLLNLLSFVAFSQVRTGIVVGGNYSMKSETEQFSYSSKVGFQLGYNWNFRIKNNWSWAASPMLVKTNMQSHRQLDNVVTDDYALGLSLPLLVNYQLKNKLFFTGGYAFTYNLENGTLVNNEFDHSLLAGIGYSLKFMDLNLLYSSSLNEESYGGVSSANMELQDYPILPEYSLKHSTVRLSIVFPIGGNR